uniref:Uncharacterized protein n=1 Tax=Glossina morsitans morsitans TaxID=37546 RepID=A0A1B0G3Y3_GLOMM
MLAVEYENLRYKVYLSYLAVCGRACTEGSPACNISTSIKGSWVRYDIFAAVRTNNIKKSLNKHLFDAYPGMLFAKVNHHRAENLKELDHH